MSGVRPLSWILITWSTSCVMFIVVRLVFCNDLNFVFGHIGPIVATCGPQNDHHCWFPVTIWNNYHSIYFISGMHIDYISLRWVYTLIRWVFGHYSIFGCWPHHMPPMAENWTIVVVYNISTVSWYFVAFSAVGIWRLRGDSAINSLDLFVLSLFLFGMYLQELFERSLGSSMN